MKKSISKIAAALILSTATPALACSVFCTADAERSGTAYSMEWPGDIFVNYATNSNFNQKVVRYLGGGVFTNPKGLQKQSLIGGSSFRWTSKYNSLVLSEFGPDFGFNGVNEKGLEVYLLAAPTRAKDPRKGPQISEMDVLSLLLDTADTADAAVNTLKSVQLEHRLFPLHIFIKDQNGKVAIVEYKKTLEIYFPEGRDAILTNNFFPDEQNMRRTGVKTSDDDRSLQIDISLKKKPKDLETPLAEVGDPTFTKWSTQSLRKGNQWTYIIKVNPLAKKAMDRREMTFDLATFFSEKSFPPQRSFLLFSEFSVNGKNSASALTDEDIRMTQWVNFQIVKQNQSMLLGRNEDKVQQSIKFLDKIMKITETKALTEVVSEAK